MSGFGKVTSAAYPGVLPVCSGCHQTWRVTDERIEETEQWFVRRGLPHLINDYSASEDVFTRALPLLTLVFLLSMVGAVNDEFSLEVNAGVVVGGFLLLLAVWAGVNWIRGHRPLLARPERVGGVELTVFVLGPALVPIVFGGQFDTAAITVATNLVILGAVYLFTSYAVLAMLRWGARRLVRDFRSASRIGMRALPLLLLFNAFLFINAEVWQVTSRIDEKLLLGALGLFVVLGILFLLSRLPGEVSDLADFGSWEQVEPLVTTTPAAALTHGSRLPDYPLTRRQRGNVGLVLVFSQGVLVLAVSVFIFLFFVAFGLLIMNVDTLVQWTERPLHEWYSVGFSGDRIVLSEELVRAAGFLAAFSGLYFTVNAASEPTYRREFFDHLLGEVRQAMAVRQKYLASLDQRP